MQKARAEQERFTIRNLPDLVLIIRTIRAGNYPKTAELAEMVGRDYRTITRWLRALREIGAPLEYNAKYRGHYFSREWFLDQ